MLEHKRSGRKSRMREVGCRDGQGVSRSVVTGLFHVLLSTYQRIFKRISFESRSNSVCIFTKFRRIVLCQEPSVLGFLLPLSTRMNLVEKILLGLSFFICKMKGLNKILKSFQAWKYFNDNVELYLSPGILET